MISTSEGIGAHVSKASATSKSMSVTKKFVEENKEKIFSQAVNIQSP